jgi:hypothetical protein
MCGSTQAQNQINQAQTNFYNNLTQTYQTEFGQGEGIFSDLSSSLAPIVAAGVNQQGFSAAELAGLNTQAIQNAGNTYAQESQAANESMAARGGGNVALPSGAQNQVQEEIGTAAENQKSSSLNTINLQNYATGRQNYFNAVGALSGLPAAIYNPLSGAGSAATGAGSAAMTGATEIQQSNDSWMGVLGGVISNIAGDATKAAMAGG